MIISGLSGRSSLTSMHLAADGRVDVRHGLHGLDDAERLVLADLVADRRQFDEDDVAELLLRVVGDADRRDLPRSAPTRARCEYFRSRETPCTLLACQRSLCRPGYTTARNVPPTGRTAVRHELRAATLGRGSRPPSAVPTRAKRRPHSQSRWPCQASATSFRWSPRRPRWPSLQDRDSPARGDARARSVETDQAAWHAPRSLLAQQRLAADERRPCRAHDPAEPRLAAAWCRSVNSWP